MNNENMEVIIDEVLNQITDQEYDQLKTQAANLYEQLEIITSAGHREGFQILNEYIDILEKLEFLRNFFYYQKGILDSAIIKM